MARRVFYSFHFDNDAWRASQVRGIGALEGNAPVSPNDWEAVQRGGDLAIQRWIAGQMKGRSCAVVLVGSATARRPWVNYEIKKAWEDKLGVVGVRIHRLKNEAQAASVPGANPFEAWNVNGVPLSQIVTLYDPPGGDSKAVYASIAGNLDRLVEAAIAVRAKH